MLEHLNSLACAWCFFAKFSMKKKQQEAWPFLILMFHLAQTQPLWLLLSGLARGLSMKVLRIIIVCERHRTSWLNLAIIICEYCQPNSLSVPNMRQPKIWSGSENRDSSAETIVRDEALQIKTTPSPAKDVFLEWFWPHVRNNLFHALNIICPFELCLSSPHKALLII